MGLVGKLAGKAVTATAKATGKVAKKAAVKTVKLIFEKDEPKGPIHKLEKKAADAIGEAAVTGTIMVTATAVGAAGKATHAAVNGVRSAVEKKQQQKLDAEADRNAPSYVTYSEDDDYEQKVLIHRDSTPTPISQQPVHQVQPDLNKPFWEREVDEYQQAGTWTEPPKVKKKGFLFWKSKEKETATVVAASATQFQPEVPVAQPVTPQENNHKIWYNANILRSYDQSQIQSQTPQPTSKPVWICLYCDTKNTGYVCDGCGAPRLLTVKHE